MLGDAGEALGLLPDVADKVLWTVSPVHLLVLEDGVGQQADGGQGGLQLMGGRRSTKRRRTSSVV